MEGSKKEIILDRLKNMIYILDRQRSGSKVHNVLNILHMAHLLIDNIKVGCLTEEEVVKLTESVERKTVEVIKSLYGGYK